MKAKIQSNFFDDWMHLWIPFFHLLQTAEKSFSSPTCFNLTHNTLKHAGSSEDLQCMCNPYIFSSEWCVLHSLFSLCLPTAQRPLSGLCLQAACSCWLASSCAQAEFSPTTPIMKIKTCGRGPNRYCRLIYTVKHTHGCGSCPRGCKIAQHNTWKNFNFKVNSW